MRLLIKIIFVLLITTPLYSAQVDLSSSGDFTHTDPSGTLTETPYRVRWESLDSTDTSYHYESRTTSGDFNHKITFGFDSGSSGVSAVGIWSVSDTVGTISALQADTDAHALILWLEDTGSVCTLNLTERDGASLDETQSVTLSETYRNKALRLTITRVSDAFVATVYRDGPRTEQLYQISLTLNSVQTYDYLFMCMNNGEVETIAEYTTGQDNVVTVLGTTRLAQTFAGNGGNIVEGDIYARRSGAGGTVITFAIYATTAGKPSGTALTTTTENYTGWSTDYEWHNFVFASPYTLSNGTIYALVISTNGTTGNGAGIGLDTSSPTYADGSGVHSTDSGSTWTIYTAWELLFSLKSCGVSDGFSGELYISESPAIWTKSNVFPIMINDDYDGFEGFPTSHETWTVGGTGTSIAEDETWDSDGDGYCVKIVEAGASKYATMTCSDTTLDGFVVSATVKFDSITTNTHSKQLAVNDGGSNWIIAGIVDVSGTAYWRLTDESVAWSSSTTVECETGVEYDIVLTHNAFCDFTTLVVNGVLADVDDSDTDFNLTTIRLGGTSGSGEYGTRYIDDIKIMNGNTYGPTICRGGDSDGTLVTSFARSGTSNIYENNTVYVLYSINEGATWALSTSFNDSDYLFFATRIVWVESRSSWYLFLVRASSTVAQQTLVYECTSLSTPTYTLLETHSDSPRIVQISPSREIIDGKILACATYLDTITPDATDNYVTAGLIDITDGSYDSEYRFGSYGDVTDYEWVTEPNPWHSDGVLYGMIRHSNPGPHSNVVERYRISTDDGASDWHNNTLYNPGTDWFMRAAWMRAFVFREHLFWMGRDALVSTAPADHMGDEYTSFIMKTAIEPDANNLIPVVSEMWEESYGLGGNGDIDARIQTGTLYLDVVNCQWGGSGWYMSIDTGEIGSYAGILWY